MRAISLLASPNNLFAKPLAFLLGLEGSLYVAADFHVRSA
eukprot:CAMPEP_0182492776 /NCGR_PEP_ID=MMETSP1321-20130603/1856_1 /TAXON_ID=91990 /ORGANISM="Bolidomonas sp., Strain RCC1657" /LENGTH=39 /DNA_ID= /DNA_START= /DNA_END= /DNA_ORIENTATION=